MKGAARSDEPTENFIPATLINLFSCRRQLFSFKKKKALVDPLYAASLALSRQAKLAISW